MSRESIVDSIKVRTFKEIDRARPSQLTRFAFLVEPGEYKARMTLTDLETLGHLAFEKKVHVPDYNKSGLLLADLQLATQITPSVEQNSVLAKNGRKVVPNVLHLVEPSVRPLYVYSEFYNLQSNAEGPNDEFVATFVIEDRTGREIQSWKLRHKKAAASCALSVGLTLDEFDSGGYQLSLTVQDPATGQSVRKSTPFQAVNPPVRPYLISRLVEK